LGVLERVLGGRSRDAERLSAHGWSRGLKGRHRGLARGALTFSNARQLLVQLLLAAQETAARYSTVFEDHFGGVTRANAHLLELLTHAQSGRSFGHDERGLAPTAELGVDGRDDDVNVGDAAVGDPGLRAVQDPLVVYFVVDRARAKRRDVTARVGLGDAKGREFDVVGRAETARHPLHLLFGRAVRDDGRDAQRRTHDRHAQTSVTPGEFLEGDHERETRLVADGVHQEVETVHAELGGLFDEGPGRLFTLVPLGGDGAHLLFGEAVQPVAQRDLVLVEFNRKIAHVAPWGRKSYLLVTKRTVEDAEAQ